MSKKAPYHHLDLRGELMVAALEELATEGPRRFSLRSVAARAGVSHTAPYRHFTSKDDLLAAVFLEGMRMLTGALREATAAPSAGPPRVPSARERLIAQGRAYIGFARSHPGHMALMFSETGFAAMRGAAMADPAMGPDATDYDAFGELERAVVACQREGSLDPAVDKATLAMLVWSTVHGLALLLGEGVIADMAEERGMPASGIEAALLAGMESLFFRLSGKV
jgi:AcrR family transcriptional regulator